MNNNLEIKASNLLNECPNISLASINEKGYPRVCVVSQLGNEGHTVIYLSTGTDSRKVEDFKSNPKASISYHNGGDSVSLTGNISIVEDMDKKQELWQDWLINHFPEGVSDPNYCLLKFSTVEATIWIDQEFETIFCEE